MPEQFLTSRTLNVRPRDPGGRAAFSLVEILVVIGVIAILMAMLAPAISSFGGSGGRAGAVTLVMNTFEQARAAALESGSDVYVLMWRRNFPEQDALMVVRERNEWDTEPGTGPIALSRWMKLPKGVIIREVGVTSLADSGDPTGGLAGQVPGDPEADRLSVLQFSPSGVVLWPSSGNPALYLSEGVRDAAGNIAAIGSPDADFLEVISVRRFTGRSQLDVSSIGSL